MASQEISFGKPTRFINTVRGVVHQHASDYVTRRDLDRNTALLRNELAVYDRLSGVGACVATGLYVLAMLLLFANGPSGALPMAIAATSISVAAVAIIGLAWLAFSSKRDVLLAKIELVESALFESKVVTTVKIVAELVPVFGERFFPTFDCSDVVSDILNTIVCLGPVLTVWSPDWRLFTIFSGAATRVLSYKERLVLWIMGKLPADWLDESRRKVTYGVLAGLVGLPALWLLYKRFYPCGETLAIVPKKKQKTSADPPAYVPVPPSELSGLRAFPDSPRFKGVAGALSSLCSIQTRDASATAFRCANSVLTVGHCLMKNEGEIGIWLLDPTVKEGEDGRYCWAPLEKKWSKAPRDAIAVCSLPNSTYFQSLQSPPISVPKKDHVFPVTCFCKQKGTTKGIWDVTQGSAQVNSQRDHILDLNATVMPGSSGGPIINVDGSIVGLVFAESGSANHGFCVTSELIDFLTKGGGAKQPKSPQKYCEDPSDTEYSETESCNEYSTGTPSTPAETGPGPARPKKKKAKKSPGTNGTTPNDDMRRKPSERPKHPSEPADEDSHLPSASPTVGISA